MLAFDQNEFYPKRSLKKCHLVFQKILDVVNAFSRARGQPKKLANHHSCQPHAMLTQVLPLELLKGPFFMALRQ